MPAMDQSSRRCNEPQPYEIRVQGHLAARWATWVDGLTLTHAGDGTTTLRGPPLDQAALHGLLTRIRDLGVPIISLRRLCPDSEAGQASDERPA
jgi:hypothetical protein